ncbi:MAG: glucan biosynthesis protein D [Halothiobacillaceae bacterium]|nr:glucan biosynthesis protein D [Halothiobacillaceae bacterium]
MSDKTIDQSACRAHGEAGPTCGKPGRGDYPGNQGNPGNPGRRRWFRLLLAMGLGVGMARSLSAAADDAETGLVLGEPQAFDFERLVDRAEQLARDPYEPPSRPVPEAVQSIDYDAAGRIHYRREAALWRDGPSVYPITFRPLGEYFPTPVAMHVVEAGEARPVRYRPAYFEMPSDSPLRQVPEDESALAGFWVHRSRRRGDWYRQEPWVTFQGASYFRAVSHTGQVGLSARGIAVNTAAGSAEEFPEFRAFWFEPARNEGDPIVVYALLDGPSVAGAYRFALRARGDTEIEVDKRLFIRKTVDQLGIAPLTSMHWYAETPNAALRGWRPEVHDSDTLAIWTGRGERLVRPLINPTQRAYSAFVDENPRGFGLLQRDRHAMHYLDGVGYEKRPSAWVEPLGEWGAGHVTLVELPTDDETFDNIVAFWQPAGAQLAGSSLRYRYRLYWQDSQPFGGGLARAVSLRAGPGGDFGKRRIADTVRLVIGWQGAALADLDPDEARFDLQVVPDGEVTTVRTRRLLDRADRWQTEFDLRVTRDDPVELRGTLKVDDRPIAETWLYQYHRRLFRDVMP